MIRKFEDLKVWQDARMFVNVVYNLTNSDVFRKDYGLKDQIQRASVSIMNNIAEGFERDNNKEFVKFLLYAKGSAGEVRSLLYIAYDLHYIAKEEFETALEQSLNIIKQISKFISYLKTKTN
ncbi:ribosomal protein S23 [Melioribacter roseus P3M-2]|uniref:Ribosomal protein S23 n=1 Tax=Melioribacter roseus (strain DSM 23840 / JCM 17771 / VKM B-2668 / P3M-2) TaxID=1191523 RepID=I7A2A3_MELRP|nr:four helix bundle protein [Melioribacter roseus]AFN74051.1 ribosomal protein S23 [Melioribacter roseus P3M-2]